MTNFNRNKFTGSVTTGLAIFLISACLILLPACKAKEEQIVQEIPKVPVQVNNATVGTITSWHRTTCELVSPLEISVSFGTGGRILELTAREGDTVVEGQYLGRVDTSTLVAQRSAIMSQADSARSQAHAAELGAQAATAQVDMARAAANQAETDFYRFESLFKDGVATQSEFEQAQLRYETAQLALQAAMEQSDAAGAQAVAAAGAVDAVVAQAGQVSEMIDDGTLRAPFSGRIASQYIDVGAMVGAGTPIFRLVGDGESVANQLEVQLTIPESLTGTVTTGTTMYVTFASCEDELQIPVNHLGPEVSTENRTVKVFGYIDRDAACLLPGMFGTVRIPVEVRENAVILPERAVIELESGPIVYVAQGDTAVRRDVTTGLREEGTVEIVEGIQPGDNVIVTGNTFLTDGAKIEIRNDSSDAQAEGISDTEGAQ